ncbi:phage holin family protein [Pseudoduganella ginsengisoli]|uniref:Phage holin family protein n=1 Tax=Pseudoduganella ginsengisoli TaxID=1462440 RepID=A0A6L6Q167_9BURK|nr:phage holin family protein [Pseudoduganella ginsengisoli]MTW03286.1 phage holin family protein [Pseudoduganella ginsengisoli]
MEQPAPSHPGLIASLAAVARNTGRLMLSRLELAALELSEARNHLVELAVVFALALLAGWFAIAFTTATIIFLCWEAMGWKILLVLAVAFLLITIGFIMSARSMLRQGKLSLPATMAELKADREMLL